MYWFLLKGLFLINLFIGFFFQIYKKELKLYNNYVYLVVDNEIILYESVSVIVS